MTTELRFALEESNRVCKVPNYFGYTDAKLHAWETLPTRNDQLLAVLKVHQPQDIVDRSAGMKRRECAADLDTWPCQTIQAIQEAGN